MITKQEEINNLSKLHNELQNIERLEEELDNLNHKIHSQQSRVIADYPNYQPANYAEQCQPKSIDFFALLFDRDEIKNKIPKWVYFIKRIIPLLVGAVELILLRVAGVGWDKLAIYACVLFGPIFLSFTRLGLLASAIQGLQGLFLSNPDYGLRYSSHNFHSVVLRNAVVMASSIIVVHLVSILCVWIGTIVYNKKEYPRELAEAKRKDAEHLAEYKKAKAVADVQIARKREALSADVSRQIAHYSLRIQQIERELKQSEHIVATIPGLAAQDKNIHMVSTLLEYFNRNRISSIKEGINLYLQEQRLNQMERDARLARWMQERALKQIQEEQEYHNERIREIAREEQEKIDKALDEIKYGR